MKAIPTIGHCASRRIAYILYDAGAIALALTLALALRMNGSIPPKMWEGLVANLPVFIVSGLITFHFFGLYRRVWRVPSLSDLSSLLEAASISIAVPVLMLVAASRARWLPTSVPIIQWLVLVAILVGGRIGRRILSDRLREIRRQHHVAPASPEPPHIPPRRALIVGLPEQVALLLRQIEATPNPGYVPVGIIDTGERDVELRLRDVPILGGIDALEHVVGKLAARDERPSCLILAGGAAVPGNSRLRLVAAAETLGLSVLRAPSPTEIGQPLDLEVIDLADLLGRPQAKLDEDVVLRALKGQRVMVTGAGGTIGRELVRQIATMDPAEIILLECGEFNLYSVELELRENYPHIACTPLLCSIRQRRSVMAAFERHRPDFVFHTAALKHVPLVETNICAGVQTNVLGTRNVADAAQRYGVRAMVQVSTDKAVNPVGIMGASKRLGELYCQALDLDGVGDPGAARFMTVRFGNVLGSSGSLIPLFQRQLKRRAPLTVTHPEITRYFMTVHEAVQLVLHSMARAMECDVRRGRIVVLDMGEPVKIIDIARRMIRLAGLEPDKDVPIQIVGLRPGEKLYEELFDEREQRLPSALPGVFEAEPSPVPIEVLREGLEALSRAIMAHQEESVKHILFSMIEPGGSDMLQVAPKQPAAAGRASAVWPPEALVPQSL
ncbi:polysaccharide biosynthesis protein [Sphingomonas sp. PR090111-T3T-6A]|uniref:polysaccharide biosynthesis protein n=1 Tax=Sphingomonas sp. PR090111-T3T-6A TaxID=685778 RepID=UPI0003724063|nr:nucleoside-diphosphate sugar epimerase/dehydratase [Sphingomonas sp. PR090111-T3T-6A]